MVNITHIGEISMSVKKKLMTGMLMLGASLPLMANAGLTITNNTDFDSTSIINNAPICSSSMTGGVTPAHSVNNVPDKTVWWACITNTTNCTADVYLTNNCTGPKIATVTFDVKTGIKSVVMHTSDHQITGAGFDIVLN
jgi:hypothetical protein